MRVFLTGGTGLIGSRIVRRLLDRRDSPVLLTRSAARTRGKFPAEVEIIEGDPMRPGPWQGVLGECDAVINLVGEGINAKRWSDSFKKVLTESRTISSRNVVAALRDKPLASNGRPKVLVNASAVGYYGPHEDDEVDENTPPAGTFLGRLCADWEKEAFAALAAGVRVCTVRVGLVLDRNGGALGSMLPPFRWGLGGRLGSGKQWMSWIHHEDMMNLFLIPLDNPRASGAINGTSPNPVTNAEFTRVLGKVLNRPTWLPAPGWGLRMFLGEFAEAVLTGQRVMPRAALSLGYTFKFPTLELALRDVLA